MLAAANAVDTVLIAHLSDQLGADAPAETPAAIYEFVCELRDWHSWKPAVGASCAAAGVPRQICSAAASAAPLCLLDIGDERPMHDTRRNDPVTNVINCARGRRQRRSDPASKFPVAAKRYRPAAGPILGHRDAATLACVLVARTGQGDVAGQCYGEIVRS